jgi:DNA-binding NtrC family response regulator
VKQGRFFHLVADYERKLITERLTYRKGNQRAVADDLGMHRNVLRDYCDKLGIDPSAFYEKQEEKRIVRRRPKHLIEK